MYHLCKILTLTLFVVALCLMTSQDVNAQRSGRRTRVYAYDPATGIPDVQYGMYRRSDPAPWRPRAYDTHDGWVTRYLYDRPTVSPYLNLLRHDAYFYTTTRYDALVRPREQRLLDSKRPDRTVRARTHFDPATGLGAVRRPKATVGKIRPTGHPTHFMSQYGGYNAGARR